MRNAVKISLSFFLCFLISGSLKAQTQMISLPIGSAQSVDERMIMEEVCLPLIEVNSLLYVVDDDLMSIGMYLEENESCFTLIDGEPAEHWPMTYLPDESGQNAYSISKPVYFHNKRSHLVVIGSHYYVPVELLQEKWNIEEHHKQLNLTKKLPNFYLSALQLSEKGVQNQGDSWLQLKCRHGFWLDTAFDFVEEHFLLGPGESYEWQKKGNGIYAGTQIIEGNGVMISLEGQTDFQHQQPFYKAYRRAEKLHELEKLFPAYVLEAKMRYSFGKLKESQEVTLLRSEKHAYYWVMDQEGRKYQVPFGSVQILGERGVRILRVTDQQIAEFANLMEIKSETPYLLWTDVYRQRTYVLEKKKDVWQMLQSFICSTGKNVNPTPTGLYKVQYAIPYFGLGKGFRCKYALVFFRDYMYHSILFDKTGQYIKSGQYELGSKASHGCIRLSEKDSNWLYSHIPVKTTVWIR